MWDYIILTASNEDHAEGYQMQIKQRKDYLPTATYFAAIPDEGGVRVGSGGATLSVICYIHEQEKIRCDRGHFDNLPTITRVSGAKSPGNTMFLLRVHRTRTTYFFHIAAVGEYLIPYGDDGFLPPVLLYVYLLLL